MQEKSAGAVVFYKEKGKVFFLLLHYAAGHWDFPKGHIENEETEIETARREVQEETGISELDIKEGFRHVINYSFRATYNLKKEERPKAPMISKEVIFYLAETRQKEIKISHEHKGFKWLEYGEAMAQVRFKNAKSILNKAHEFLKAGGI